MVENYETGGKELFNLKEDISESKDLKIAYQEKAKELYEMLKSWQKENSAKMPVRKPAYDY